MNSKDILDNINKYALLGKLYENNISKIYEENKNDEYSEYIQINLWCYAKAYDEYKKNIIIYENITKEPFNCLLLNNNNKKRKLEENYTSNKKQCQ